MESRTAKRLRVNKACLPCRAAKRRCEGEIPCARCVSKKLPCGLDDDASSPQLELRYIERSTQDGEPLPLRLDLPPRAISSATLLINRYFDEISPFWPLVDRSDLAVEPFAPPLLTRSICLVAATYLSKNPLHDQVVSDILSSVQQCFDSFEVATMPSLWSLQSFLLLISCPRIEQVSMLISAAGRMALLLGLHKPQNPRLFLFWSCVLASRWDSLRHADSRVTSRPCPDLMTFAPSSGPEEATIFTWFFDIAAEADQERCDINSRSKHGGNDWEEILHQMGGRIITERPGLKEMILLTGMYLKGQIDSRIVHNLGGLAKQCCASNLNPFASVLQELGIDK